MVPRPAPQTALPPLIPEFFAGREVFITGATGFMGKVLVERLLWTCPEVSKLHLLMRPKKLTSPEKRLKDLKMSEIFGVIREQCPQRLEKLCAVAGDITKSKLGFDIETIRTLNQVSVVFHSAATLKFEEPLDVAVEQNYKSVIKVMDLCDQLPLLQVMLYVSTAYSNAELSTIEERVYPLPMNHRQLLTIVENLPKEVLTEITPKLISSKPNTYVFTKAMAENAVAERATFAKYATAIFRPTIVVSSIKSPFPGWIENLNGPSGLVVTVGKGLLHVLPCSGSKRADMVPVDLVIDTLLAVAWETGVDDLRETRVYNCSSYENPTTWEQFRVRGLHMVRHHPFDTPLVYPTCFFTENRLVQKVAHWALNVAPLRIMNYLCNAFGINVSPSFAVIIDRLQAMINVLKYFMNREWRFSTDNVRRLKERLAPADAVVFNLDVSVIDWDDHFSNFVKGTRRYLLKEKDVDIAKAQRRIRWLYVLHRSVLGLAAFVIFRLTVYTGAAIYGIIASFF